MIAPIHGDTAIMDMPESWISCHKTQEEIIGYRLNLVRGKHRTNATDLDNPFVEKLQDISLSDTSVESEVSFLSRPEGMSFSEEHTPFGPSATLERFEIESGRWDRSLEKVYYDTDLKSADAIVDLHKHGVAISSIQKAFSVGIMGRERGRRLVPTRWSITACDTMIGDHLLKEVKKCPVIDTWRVHEFSSLHNNYAVILMPNVWQYEWSEAFCTFWEMRNWYSRITRETKRRQGIHHSVVVIIPARWLFSRRLHRNRNRQVLLYCGRHFTVMYHWGYLMSGRM